VRAEDDRQRRPCTINTFGFDTAVSTVVEALDKLHTTAESHDRVLVVEVMGRDAGFIALYAGVGRHGRRDPHPRDPVRPRDGLREDPPARARGARFAIVVIAEGAVPKGGTESIIGESMPGQARRLGGVAEPLARLIQERTGKETRSLVLGHLQRGGQPTGYDRLLSMRFGGAAIRAIEEAKWGHMVAPVAAHRLRAHRRGAGERQAGGGGRRHRAHGARARHLVRRLTRTDGGETRRRGGASSLGRPVRWQGRRPSEFGDGRPACSPGWCRKCRPRNVLVTSPGTRGLAPRLPLQ
jgi:hypothetical protein